MSDSSPVKYIYLAGALIFAAGVYILGVQARDDLPTSQLPTETAVLTRPTDIPVRSGTGNTPTLTPVLSPTSIAPLDPFDALAVARGLRAQRLINGDFEGQFLANPDGEGATPSGWFIVACAEPWTDADCQTEDGDPQQTPIWRPVTAPDDAFRIISGEAAGGMHCDNAACTGGYWQIIPTIPGETCTARIWIQTHTADGQNSNVSGRAGRSDYDTLREQENARAWIAVADAADATPHYPEPPIIRRSRDFGYLDGIYDELGGGAAITYTFLAQSSETAIFFMAENAYPTAYAAFYFDQASVDCAFDQAVAATPDIPVITHQDARYLARLCIAEVRGMEDLREDACLSVISTVMARIVLYRASSGAWPLGGDSVAEVVSIFSIADDGNETWQFPPWVYYTCEMVDPSACLDVYLQDSEWAFHAVTTYQRGKRGTCDGYLYYDSILGGNSDCLLRAPKQWIEFHTGWGWEPVVNPTPGPSPTLVWASVTPDQPQAPDIASTPDEAATPIPEGDSTTP